MATNGNKKSYNNLGGRPTLFKDEYIRMAGDLALMGLTDKQIAAFFKVSEVCLNRWKKQHPEFNQSIQAGKLPADAKVVAALYKRALGYSYVEETFEKIDSKENLEVTSAGEITTDDTYKKKIVTKEVVPDVTAQKFWLMNRQRKSWTDRHDITGTLNLRSDLEKLSEEQLDQIISRLSENRNAGDE